MAIVLIAVVYFLDWLDYEKIEPQQVEKPVEVVVQSEENVVIDVVENSMDAVVSIAASQIEFRADEGIVDTVSNIGSGFIVDPSGVIITNQHVVSQQDIDYKVITNDGREYEVVQILQCSINDIALLKIEAEDLSVIPLGNSDNLKPGQLVIAIGTPLGEYAGSVTTGVVSGLNRSVTAGSQGFWGVARTYEDVIQISAAVNPGNSGGPLLNSLGEVIGVNFATTAGAENISFALPSNVVSRRFDEYRQYGKFLKPYLGIEYQMITENQAMFYDDLEPGVLVRRVVDGSPADEAGLQRLDVIVEVDGEPITQSFANIIQSYEIGQEMKMTVLREGEKIELVAILEEMDE
jgi:serine protease Do